MPKPKAYYISAKELTRFVKSLKKHSVNVDAIFEGNRLSQDARTRLLAKEMNRFDCEVDLFIYFQCEIPLKDLTTENVLSDKFKI